MSSFAKSVASIRALGAISIARDAAVCEKIQSTALLSGRNAILHPKAVSFEDDISFQT